jgi:FHS family L-fucose permease-like MFS transporter
LRPHSKLGSSLLVMSIIGGAVLPAMMGFISDSSNIRYAFFVPFACHLSDLLRHTWLPAYV